MIDGRKFTRELVEEYKHQFPNSTKEDNELVTKFLNTAAALIAIAEAE